MTPFLQFRVWLRRGPHGERIGAAIGSLVVLAMLVWAALPLNGESSTPDLGVGVDAPTGQLDPAEPIADALPVEEPAGESANDDEPPAGSGSPTTGHAATGAADEPCTGLQPTDQGVTPTEIFVAVAVPDLGGELGNETVGVRNDLGDVAAAYTAAINEQGGVACRRLRIKVYKVNPLDQNDARAKCLEIVDDKAFAVVEYASFGIPATRSCFVEAKIPLQDGTGTMIEDEAAGAYPFLYSAHVSTDRAARTWVFEAASRGFFAPQNGFRKLGLLLNGCSPNVSTQLRQDLNTVGVRNEQMSVFTTACGRLTAPNQLSQAVLQHRSDGASHVYLGTNPIDGQNYVRQADGVRWKPAYFASDFYGVATPTVENNWSDGFDGTIAITGRRTGERNSGIEHPAITRCNDWLRKRKVAPSETDQDAGPLVLCDGLRLFAAAANAVGPNVVRTTLLEGLKNVGRFEGATYAVGVFDRPRKLFGMDFVRATQWHLDCKCWKVLDQEMSLGRLSG